MSLSPTSCKLFLGRRDKPPDLRARRGAASAAKIVVELTAYRVRVVGRERHGRSRPADSTNRLSAVTLVPRRSRAAHVVQLRSIAAVRQDGCNGSENGQKIHPRYPNAIPHGTCSERQFRPTNGTCKAIMWNEAGGNGSAGWVPRNRATRGGALVLPPGNGVGQPAANEQQAGCAAAGQ